MEFNFSVNALFREKLSKVKNNLMPENYGGDRRGDGDVVTKVSTVLDKMGIVSAKAQNLPMAITSASKLRNSDHVVYILTDPEGNRGHGTVVGILKVGCKKLFVYNLSGVQWEMEPLCVLDFYVHESKQRNGCGRQLFEYMLKDQQISPNHLALDQPSESFLSFMCKHYGLDSIIPQTNSFVVYESFFDGRADKGRGSTTVDGSQSRKGHRNALQCVRASSHSGDATPSYGRHSAKKAGSTMAEYMQDPSMMQSNGSRQGPPHTNHYNYDVHRDNNSTPTKFGTTKPVEAENGQMRPTSLPEKLNGSSAAAAARDDSAVDEPDVADDNSEHNGSEFATPEEVPGKLDLKFHHTHLCNRNSNYWTANHHSVPLAQYGHYWSSVGGLLSDDQTSETDDISHQNGDGKPRTRKVSNVPIGEDNSEEEDDMADMISPLTVNENDQNNHPFNVGNMGVRDVRIKKTMFQNLSPYRK